MPSSNIVYRWGSLRIQGCHNSKKKKQGIECKSRSVGSTSMLLLRRGRVLSLFSLEFDTWATFIICGESSELETLPIPIRPVRGRQGSLARGGCKRGPANGGAALR